MPFLTHSPPPPYTHPLSLHDALPISSSTTIPLSTRKPACSTSSTPGTIPSPATNTSATSSPPRVVRTTHRSEEHTSELQSLTNLVCRLLLEKKNPNVYTTP